MAAPARIPEPSATRGELAPPYTPSGASENRGTFGVSVARHGRRPNRIAALRAARDLNRTPPMRRLLVTTCVGATLCLGCNQALTTNAKTDGSPVGDVASVVIDAPTVDVDLGYCGNLPLSECENDELCWLTCGTAPGLGPTAGCALACGNRP